MSSNAQGKYSVPTGSQFASLRSTLTGSHPGGQRPTGQAIPADSHDVSSGMCCADHRRNCPELTELAAISQRALDSNNNGESTKGQRWRERLDGLACGLLRSVAVALLTFGLDEATA